MRTLIILILRRDVITHKLGYSKTIKEDPAAAILALIVSLLVGYLGLGCVGSMSVQLLDLTSVLLYTLCVTISLK